MAKNKINVYVNDDLEHELSLLSKKRKKSLSDIINMILKEWLEDYDLERIEKDK